ncbi:hypothetical protein [Haemophilus pittmaniae]|jgi:hypothetical protein|uniref:hypothetical protein n=1 Tax=Haemophilus pittmaniae TaxID=249188 RepID=UPI0028DCFFCC|nr:hypothetical protein [Haemophilus pittmaniae]
MIKINRCLPPDYLTSSKVSELTYKFKSEHKNVWTHEGIKNSLMRMSHNKCAYCEVNLGKCGCYLEVEHFKDKNTYPDDVVNWNNLLPSCKHCNVSKGKHNVVDEPIINPCDIDPREHLYFQNYRLKGKTDLGNLSIEVLDLNNTKHLVLPRCEVGNKLSERIEELNRSYSIDNEREKRKLVRTIKAILEECQADSLFSALSASVVLMSDEYSNLKNKMVSDSLWNDELGELERKSKDLVLQC